MTFSSRKQFLSVYREGNIAVSENTIYYNIQLMNIKSFCSLVNKINEEY